MGWTVVRHRLATFRPAFTPRNLPRRKALNSDILSHPKRNRNVNIPLQSLNYFFSEQRSGRIHRWSNEALKALGWVCAALLFCAGSLLQI